MSDELRERAVRAARDAIAKHGMSYDWQGVRCSACDLVGGLEVDGGAYGAHLAAVTADAVLDVLTDPALIRVGDIGVKHRVDVATARPAVTYFLLCEDGYVRPFGECEVFVREVRDV